MNHADDPTDDAKEEYLAGMYDAICRQPDVEQAIEALRNEALRELHGYISRLNVESGIPGLLRGVVVQECCNRFLNRQ